MDSTVDSEGVPRSQEAFATQTFPRGSERCWLLPRHKWMGGFGVPGSRSQVWSARAVDRSKCHSQPASVFWLATDLDFAEVFSGAGPTPRCSGTR